MYLVLTAMTQYQREKFRVALIQAVTKAGRTMATHAKSPEESKEKQSCPGSQHLGRSKPISPT